MRLSVRARGALATSMPVVTLARAGAAASRLGALWCLLLACALLALSPGPAAAQRALDVYAFVADGCPHCEKALAFLAREAGSNPALRVHRLELTRDAVNRETLRAVARELAVDDSAVPFIVIGDRVFIGYLDDRSTGAQLRARVDECLSHACRDVVAPLLAARAAIGSGAGRSTDGGAGAGAPGQAGDAREDGAALPARAGSPDGPAVPLSVTLPLLGAVSLRELSLPAVTVLLAAIDGFNPCAMWTLVFLIGLLVGMQDRARMWTLGTAFIAGSAAVYFLFLAAWLNLLLFLGSVVWVRAAIGVVAVAGGLWHLREYARNEAPVCEVTSPERRRRVFDRLKALASEKSFLLALAGILMLAFAVNLVEAVCSAGIPAVFAQVLALNPMPAWQHYAYLLLYVAVFMLDDLLVFVGAMKTLQLTGLGTRYVRASSLVGGLLLLALGAVMLLRPEWLLFG
ncbi:MAG TPA: hypothetical protein VN324_14555 [Quisquiliibacterium sp.]|nr:hypothetical protein [Quisquiliibacterium sp.]